jgi:hypothetical protein
MMLKMRGLYRNRTVIYLIRQPGRDGGLSEIMHGGFLRASYVSLMYRVSKTRMPQPVQYSALQV